MATPTPIIIILGETASGKSDLALYLAKKLNGEIIMADSWAVYRGFNIGTDKPSKNEQLAVPHHLIDVADPMEGFSAAEFKRIANQLILDIAGRDKVPIICGGAGLYIDSLIFDYSFMPAPSPELRKQLANMSLEELREKASSSGYDLSGIDTNNKRRIIRLIENKGSKPTHAKMRNNTLLIGLMIDRAKLLKNIESRVGKMFDIGLIKEVKALSKLYDWKTEPMKGIGYRELKDYLENKADIESTKQKIIKNTKDLAKKQRQWFSRNKSIHWVINREQAVELSTTFLNKFPD